MSECLLIPIHINYNIHLFRNFGRRNIVEMKFFILIVILQYLTKPINSACSGLNHGSQTNNFAGKDYESSARPGFWYIVTYYWSGGWWSGDYIYFSTNICPSGTSLMYIKTNDDWIDYKYLRGNI